MRSALFALVILVSSLAADAAEKVATDEPVRAGMTAICDLVRINHSLVTHRRMPPDHAQRFAKQIRVEADGIRAKSRIPGEAKAKLDALLDEIVAGVEAVAKPASGTAALDGIVRADEALARYPEEFVHPGWAPLQALP